MISSSPGSICPRERRASAARCKHCFSLCRAATLSWDAPSLPCGSQSRRRKNDSAKLVFVVKSPHYYTPICWIHDAVSPEFPYVTEPRIIAKKLPGSGSRTKFRTARLPLGGSCFLKFDSEKRPFLLPFGSRLIRIGCEQFKLYQLVPALLYPPTRIQRKNSPKGICTTIYGTRNSEVV